MLAKALSLPRPRGGTPARLRPGAESRWFPQGQPQTDAAAIPGRSRAPTGAGGTQGAKGVRGHIFILVGPSGGGKTTLIRRVSRYGAGPGAPDWPPDAIHPPEGSAEAEFVFVPSTTSRPPRSGEQQHVDYHFVSEAEFDALQAAGAFVEWQNVHGHRYGSSRHHLRAVVERGLQGITSADILGAFKIKAAMPADVTTVFVTPSRPETLRERILCRGRVTSAELQRRLARVAMEMELAYACDHLIRNDDLEEAVAALQLLARWRRLQASRLTHFGRRPVIRMIELADPPTWGAGTRFCIADCETASDAVQRVARQWWWELHPEATAFALPPFDPSPLGPCRAEETAEALLLIAPWRAQLPARALR